MDHNSNEVPRDIPFHLLEEITDGFSNERKLGTGAFGKVYMGEHKNGEKIAVKMLYDMPGLEEEQFLNEFYNLASLQHPNIVRLVGYCHEIQKKYVEYNGRLIFAERICRALCLEYMHNGSLDSFLSEEHYGLDWNTRYAMIKGVCKGLEYLHEELKHPIYHLDLKPANILLDENMLPKIADFGLSRLFGEEKTQVTKSPIGTPGYLPPEYIERNIVSSKFDIFSLGVVIIKIMTGPTGYSRSADLSPQQFTELVHENWRNRLQAMRVEFFESYSSQVKTCIEIALRCVDSDRHKRPSIGDIVEKLDETEALIEKSTHFSDMQKNDDLGSTMDQVSTGSSAEGSSDAVQSLVREASPAACLRGVCYGMVGDNLPSSSEVVQLYMSNGINGMRIYFPIKSALDALRNSGIGLILDTGNQKLLDLAASTSNAQWLVENIVIPYYPAVNIKYITVGNGVQGSATQSILPAMRSLNSALAAAGLGNSIKVSTSVHFSVVRNVFPPSGGVFAQNYMVDIVRYLESTDAPLLVSVYPYYAYRANPHKISLNFATFQPGTTVRDNGNGLTYTNLFDTMMDAIYAALDKAGAGGVRIVVSESGWPSAGGSGASVDNARNYNQGLIDHVGRGTLKRPGAIEAFLFAMFNENQKCGDETVRNFGLFNPSKSPMYPIQF